MPELNASQEQSQGHSGQEPNFVADLQRAQSTGDFDYVLDTAKKSHRMLLDFRDAVKRSKYPGSEVVAIAMGLNFLDNMISNSAGQISALKQTEKETLAAIKAQKNGGPEEPQTPEPSPDEPASEAA